LDRHGTALDVRDAKVDDIRVEIATLKVRASFFGAVAGVLAGLVPVLIALGMKLIGR
jgi:hypothetical protein